MMSAAGCGVLQVANTAAIDILPHQLEPAVAVLRGDGCRVLIADDVGLGKTIEAGLIIAELRARGIADRVIVLAPPGLRDQWRDELLVRFGIESTIADFRSVRQRAATLPPDTNPWTTWPVAIASIDYIKRPEILPAALNARWDVVVVDEAHRVANDGDRHRSAAALASRSGYVVLLTATPHSGDTAAFDALCNLGGHGDRLLVFRRTRQVLMSPTRRRLHRIHVRSTLAERRMFAKLDALGKAVRNEHGEHSRDVWIGLALLRKRAYSSAQALYLSVGRRLESLGAMPTAAPQLPLPLDDFGEGADDEAPDWHPALRLRDPENERRLLTSLAAAAATALRHESKIRAIRRLLRLTREPIIVFTEYRDTLAWLTCQLSEPVLQLHGGLSRAERAAAISTFRAGLVRVLLATDAAGEGLNLHQVCRTVVNLELPWNPMRLEQRIGRVDRIGQHRTVHAFHLIGADTGEGRLLEELRERIARARVDVGTPDPLDGALTSDAVAALASERVDVSSEVAGMRIARALSPAAGEQPTRPLLAKTRSARTRAQLAGRQLSIWEQVVEDARGRTVGRQLLGIVARKVIPAVGDLVTATLKASLDTHATYAHRCAVAGLSRTDAIGTAMVGDSVLFQPGLFDRRTDVAHAALRATHEEALMMLAERRDLLTASGTIASRSPRLRLVLEP